MATFTQVVHTAPYPAISPSLGGLSQNGKTVLIAGGSAGIGYAIARAFAQASASVIIICGRRTELVTSAASKLAKETPGFQGRVIGRTCDVADLFSVDALWTGLQKENIFVDVLVLNAARIQAKGPLLETELEEVWAEFLTNVRAILDFSQRFHNQNGLSELGQKKYLVNVSTRAIHNFVVTGNNPNYTLSKNSGTLLLQQIAKDISPEKMQIISFHPGTIFTDAARNAGYDENSLAWNNENLPGQFAVWAASPEAEFLHGRFVWASWDVDELRTGELRKRIDNDLNFLKIGVSGL